MPATEECPFCHAAGFIRHERVVKGDVAHRELYCGRCEKSWRDSVSPTGVERRERPRPTE